MQVILKAAGALLIVTSFASAGMTASCRQKQKLKQLDLVIWLINELNATVMFTKEDVALTFGKLQNRRDWAFLSKLNENLLQQDMISAYHNAKCELEKDLPPEVVSLMDGYFETFGSVSSASQELKNQQILDTLSHMRQDFSAECKNKGDLYSKLGVLCGAGVAILLF